MASAQLGSEQRRAALHRMRHEEFDIAVIGGGVTGCGCALDASTRGLSVALLEQRDYASGTSSRSSKLIHGGLRYLEQRDFGLVREALRERRLLLRRLCPHLVRPVSFLFPLTHRVWERAYIGAGMLLYDSLGGARAVPRHRHLTRRQAHELAPALAPDALIGAVQYHDAQVDDARHTLTLARTASLHGASLASSARVTGFLRQGDRVTGVRARDLESGEEFEVRTRAVISATGVWTDELLDLVSAADKLKVRASKGIHLLVPRERIRSSTGFVLRTENSVLFVIPWRHHWIIGTTDTDWHLDLAHPATSRADIDYLLGHVNTGLVAPLSHEDIVGVYAGLRPLLAGESEMTSELSRRHSVVQPLPGLVVVAGGKYTTYRVMARDAVDMAAAGIDLPVPRSHTEEVPLAGAVGYQARFDARERLAAESGLEVATVERLLGRYGSLMDEVLVRADGRAELLAPLQGGGDYLGVEIVYAASHEGALHLDDVLTRRTRISIETPDRGLSAAAQAAELMGEVLGWSQATVRREVAHYQARVAAERESQDKPDDRTADAARLGAPDVRMAGAGPRLWRK